MDRRQRKTREAIFGAFTALLSHKRFHQITVGEIIAQADVGRATFYAHFETKDHLLKEFCRELFCHLFDAEQDDRRGHRHIFDCEDAAPVFLHLVRHLQNNDNNILTLLSSQNNELFLSYFRAELQALVERHLPLFVTQKNKDLPRPFLCNHITATFAETVHWWIVHGMKESPELITEYFFKAV